MDLSILTGAAAVCLAGGVLPWITSGIAVVGAAVLLPEPALPALVALCALAQMTAKCGLYGVARWAPHRLPERARKLLRRAERYRERRRLLGLAVFSGALVALPPFYLITLACGVLRVPLAVFALAGIAGTVARYGLLAWAALTVPV